MWKYTQWRVSYSHRIAWILAIVVWFKKKCCCFSESLSFLCGQYSILDEVSICFIHHSHFSTARQSPTRISQTAGHYKWKRCSEFYFGSRNIYSNSIPITTLSRKLSNIPFHWQQPPDSSDACDPSPILLKYVNFCLLLFETFAVVFIFFFTFRKPLSTYLFTSFTQWCHICIHWQNSVVNNCKAKINIIQ